MDMDSVKSELIHTLFNTIENSCMNESRGRLDEEHYITLSEAEINTSVSSARAAARGFCKQFHHPEPQLSKFQIGSFIIPSLILGVISAMS